MVADELLGLQFNNSALFSLWSWWVLLMVHVLVEAIIGLMLLVMLWLLLTLLCLLLSMLLLSLEWLMMHQRCYCSGIRTNSWRFAFTAVLTLAGMAVCCIDDHGEQ